MDWVTNIQVFSSDGHLSVKRKIQDEEDTKNQGQISSSFGLLICEKKLIWVDQF